jgi:hypothetical protein
MARRPGAVTHGTARDLADHGAGYSANGESQFSRQSASTADSVKLPSYAPRQQRADKKKSPEALLKFQRSALARLRYDLSMATSTIRRQKIENNLAIKTRFIATLERSIHVNFPSTSPTGSAPARARSREISEDQITTIPGEFEADWFDDQQRTGNKRPTRD